MYWNSHSVSDFVSKKALIITTLRSEQCLGEGEQFPSPLEYTNGHSPSIFSFVIYTMNSVSEKGNISLLL
jgi:hypothetical protein